MLAGVVVLAQFTVPGVLGDVLAELPAAVVSPVVDQHWGGGDEGRQRTTGYYGDQLSHSIHPLEDRAQCLLRRL